MGRRVNRNRLIRNAKRLIDRAEGELETVGKRIKQIRTENDLNVIDLKECQQLPIQIL